MHAFPHPQKYFEHSGLTNGKMIWDEKFIPKVLEYNGATYLFCTSGFFRMNQLSQIWELIHTPFKILFGQSATVVGNGIIFFGGYSNDKYSHDLWLFTNDIFIPVMNDLKPRACHSALYLDYNNSLLISGGLSLTERGDIVPLGDMLTFDLSAFKIHEINLARPFLFRDHSLSLIYGKTVAAIGGINSFGFATCGVNLINLENGTINFVETPSQPNSVWGHTCVILENKLLISSGMAPVNKINSSCWLFDIDHLQWVKFPIKNILENASLVLPCEGGFKVYDSSFSTSVFASLRVDLTTFMKALIDLNIQSGMYSINIDERTSRLFKLLTVYTDNLESLQKALQKFGKSGGNIEELKSLSMEYNRLQVSLFRISYKRSLLSITNSNTSAPPQLKERSQNVTAEETLKLLKELREKRGKSQRSVAAARKKGSVLYAELQQRLAQQLISVPPIKPNSARDEEAEVRAKALAEEITALRKKVSTLESESGRYLEYADSFVRLYEESDSTLAKAGDAFERADKTRTAAIDAAASAAKEWTAALSSNSPGSGDALKAAARSLNAREWMKNADIKISKKKEALRSALAVLNSSEAGHQDAIDRALRRAEDLVLECQKYKSELPPEPENAYDPIYESIYRMSDMAELL